MFAYISVLLFTVKYDHIFLLFKPLSFILARWWWLPDCSTVFEEGVWQPRDFRPEVLGWWEVYLCSQSPAENQVQRKGCPESKVKMVMTVCNRDMCSVNHFQSNSNTIWFCIIVRSSIIETQNQHKQIILLCSCHDSENTDPSFSDHEFHIYRLNAVFSVFKLH